MGIDAGNKARICFQLQVEKATIIGDINKETLV